MLAPGFSISAAFRRAAAFLPLGCNLVCPPVVYEPNPYSTTHSPSSFV